jgi:hypothetical protein
VASTAVEGRRLAHVVLQEELLAYLWSGLGKIQPVVPGIVDVGGRQQVFLEELGNVAVEDGTPASQLVAAVEVALLLGIDVAHQATGIHVAPAGKPRRVSQVAPAAVALDCLAVVEDRHGVHGRDVLKVHQVIDAGGVDVGTVLGYVYPQVYEPLVAAFR